MKYATRFNSIYDLFRIYTKGVDKRRLNLLFFFIVIASISDLVFLASLIPVTEIVISNRKENYSSFTRIVENISSTDTQESLLLISLSFVVLIGFLRFLVHYIFRRYELFVRKTHVDQTSNLLFSSYLFTDFEEFGEESSAEWTRSISDVELVNNHGLNGLITIIYDALTVIAISIFLLNKSFIVLLIVGLINVVVFAAMNRFMRNRITSISNLVFLSNAQRFETISESFTSFREINVYRSHDYFSFKFDKSQRGVSSDQKTIFLGNLVPVAYELISVSSLTFLVLISMLFQYSSDQTLLLLGYIAIATIRVIPSTSRITTSLQRMRSSLPMAQNINRRILDTRLKSFKPFSSELVDQPAEYFHWNHLSGIDVSFSYPNSDVFVIKGFNFTIRKGEIIGISGPSGSGKSTFLDLILGLVKPSEGSFNLDENAVDLSSLHWQNTLGYVPQNVFISNDTVLSNLLFDKVQSSSTESEILNVLSTCQLGNLINNLPNGIHSPIGESGSMISGGERQRIGLARALLRNPNFLVLDEATSGLDHSTEMNILKDLFSTKGDMTIVVSSHSKSALSLCDRVFEF